MHAEQIDVCICRLTENCETHGIQSSQGEMQVYFHVYMEPYLEFVVKLQRVGTSMCVSCTTIMRETLKVCMWSYIIATLW